MRPRTGQHDIDLKVRIAQRLLAEGDKVKLSVMFRGREMAHPEVGREVLDKALEQLKDEAGVERPPGMEGRFLSVILTPNAKKAEPESTEAAPNAKKAEAESTEAAPNAKKPSAKPTKAAPKARKPTPESTEVAPAAEAAEVAPAASGSDSSSAKS